MKKIFYDMFYTLLLVTLRLRMAASETEQQLFKRELLASIKESITDMFDEEIRNIINEADQQMTEYIEYYEKIPKEELMPKEELYLQQHRNEVAPQTFSMLKKDSDKTEEQILLEELKPKLKMLSKAEYHYNEEKKEIEFDVSKDKEFDTGQNSMLQASAWQVLDRGNVLINISNGKSSSFLGHVAIMKDKRSYLAGSFTVEELEYRTRSQVVNYSTWHNNPWDRIAYNYGPSVYGRNKPWHAVNHAERNLIGRPYDVTHALGRSNALYSTELVFLAD